MNLLSNPYVQGAEIMAAANLLGSALVASLPKPEEVLRKDGKPSLAYRTFYTFFNALVFDFKSIGNALSSGKTLSQAITATAEGTTVNTQITDNGGTTK